MYRAAAALATRASRCVGMNAMHLRRGMNIAGDAVVAHLKSQAKMISTSEEIAQVGTISANGDCEIGDLLPRAIAKVIKEGVITVSRQESFVGLMGDGGVGGRRWSTSFSGGAIRSMHADVAAARVRRRPAGVPESQHVRHLEHADFADDQRTV